MSERKPGDGPVPVRDLMKPAQPTPEAHGEPGWKGEERAFEKDGVVWTVRPAGVGAYGTGDVGTARVLAVHFFREGEPEPLREALVPAAIFADLHGRELAGLLDRATPIVTDDA